MTAHSTDTSPATLSERAYIRLRDDIISGTLAPATKLKINMLRDNYDVGAGPLREALARLAGENLVVLEGQRGFAVAPISLEELEDIGRLRIHLEFEALSAALPGADAAWEDRLIASFHRLSRFEKSVQTGDAALAEWDRLNRAFHDATVAGCPLVWTMRLRSQILQLHERYRRLSRANSAGSRDIAAEHEALFEAVMDRDLPSCKVILTEHINTTTTRLITMFSQ